MTPRGLRPALVVIDVQNGLFGEVSTRAHDADGVLDRIEALLEAARAAAIPIILVQDDAGPGLWHREAAAWSLHPRVEAAAPAALRVQKTYGDSFRATALDDRLQALEVDQLVLAGAMTDFSVRATLQRALLKGYFATLVADAHSTLDAADGDAKEQIERLNAEVEEAEHKGLPVRCRLAGEVVLELARQPVDASVPE